MSDLITITNCKNCGQKVEIFNFCPDCGAKKITKRITFKSLMADFADRFLNLDNSFTRTFVHLFSKPEVVIEGYINGLRKRYINAFSYFAISITVTGFYGFLVKDRFIELSKIDKFSNLNSGFGSSLMDFSFQYQSAISFLSIPLLALLCRLVFLNYKKFNLTEHFVIYLYAYSHIFCVKEIIHTFLTIYYSENVIIFSIRRFSLYFIRNYYCNYNISNG